MPRLSAGRILLDLLLTLTIGMMPIACGVLMMVFQLEAKLNENVRVSLSEAIYAVDKLIDELHDASARALYLTDQPCAQALPELNAMTSGNPLLRSLVLTRNGEPQCSSLRGNKVGRINLEQLRGERLNLIFGSQSSPGLSVLTYTLDTGEAGVIATAHGRSLSSELAGFQDQLVLIARIGEATIWASGSSTSDTGTPVMERRGVKTSAKYGYMIEVGYPPGQLGREVRMTFPIVLPSLLLVGLFTASMAYWSLYRKERELRYRRPARDAAVDDA